MALKRLRDLPGRIRRMPARWLVPLVVVLLGGIVTASIFMYRTYNYVQHDNDFCLSCHLMREPYERFAQSAHRGLGCKACHQPTPIARAQMGLAQIIEQPESLTVHAEVPNERCIDCHVKGNPAEWRLISNSAGHRIHLESTDRSLRELTCVQCHSTSVHEFAATSRTCGQSGCHETTDIRLGKMGQLTMHCIACHDFSRPIRSSVTADSLRTVLQPQREQCLSCHQMRALVADTPADDPHAGACGACHDPHEQRTPAEAVQSCGRSGCHTRPDTVSPMHRGLDPGVLSACTRCHSAHKFGLEQVPCLSCHQDVFTRPSPRLWSSAANSAVQLAQNVQAPGQRGVAFEHARHRGVACAACHQSTRSHGALRVMSFRDCQTCHHGQRVAADCARCHNAAEFSRPYAQATTFRISAGETRRQRSVSFEHAKHRAINCQRCHTDPVLRAASVNCLACHAQHHEPTRECRACHTPPPGRAHDLRVHTGCAGSGCHTRMPVEGVPRTREFCLVCHQNMVAHRPGGNCAQCHALPAPRTAPARSGEQP